MTPSSERLKVIFSFEAVQPDGRDDSDVLLVQYQPVYRLQATTGPCCLWSIMRPVCLSSPLLQEIVHPLSAARGRDGKAMQGTLHNQTILRTYAVCFLSIALRLHTRYQTYECFCRP